MAMAIVEIAATTTIITTSNTVLEPPSSAGGVETASWVVDGVAVSEGVALTVVSVSGPGVVLSGTSAAGVVEEPVSSPSVAAGASSIGVTVISTVMESAATPSETV